MRRAGRAGTARRFLGRLRARGPGGASWLGVVSGARLAHFIVDRTHPANVGVAARVHEGLLGWDAGCYETIARVGYGAMGSQSLRFFPAVPMLTHVAGLVARGGRRRGAVVVVQRGGVRGHGAALRPRAPRDGRRRGGPSDHLVPQSGPGRLVLVMGYAESTLLCLALGCFLALRPPPAPASAARPHFALAGLLAFLAALSRPIGVLLALAVAVELVRWWIRLSSEPASGRAGGAPRRPPVGLLAFWAVGPARGRGLLDSPARPVPVVAPRWRWLIPWSRPITTLRGTLARPRGHRPPCALGCARG